MAVRRIVLENFRNHKTFISDIESDAVFISGQNGAGKTSILEAISFFAPGKGIRGVRYSEAIHNGSDAWSVHAELESAEDLIKVGGRCALSSGRRNIRVDERNISSPSELLSLARIMWLTPQMDGVLADSKSIRRKFLDRLTYNFFPEHAESVQKYEFAMRSRLKILRTSKDWDDLWLSQLERVMIEESELISDRRMKTIQKIEPYITKAGFATPKMELIYDGASIDSLKSGRAIDAKIGRTLVGCHRADFKITNNLKGTDAAYSSTGEQKSMLISIVIGQVMALNAEYGLKPILLLDDILSHIDSKRCIEILSKISQINAQIWVTSTDIDDMMLSKIYKNYVKINI